MGFLFFPGVVGAAGLVTTGTLMVELLLDSPTLFIAMLLFTVQVAESGMLLTLPSFRSVELEELEVFVRF